MAGNANSGRRRLPTAVKQRRGSRIRHDVKREPAFEVGEPPIPPHIAANPYALAAWRSFAPRLIAARVLTTAHGEPLALLADAWGRYQRASDEWAALNYPNVQTIEIIKGPHVSERVVEHPLVRQLGVYGDTVKRLCAEFGLTPASASKVQTITDTAADPFEAFLRGPNVVDFKKGPPK